MGQAGFGDIQITGDEKAGFKISFLPSNPEARKAIDEKNIPSLEILPSSGTGLTIQNNLPSVDALFFVQNQGKEIGLASARALAIDAAANELASRMVWMDKQVDDYNKKAKLVMRQLNQTLRGITHESPSAASRTQKEQFQKATSIGNINGLRREGVAAMGMQVHLSWLFKTMANNYKSKLGKYGAPRDDAALAKELQNVFFESNGFASTKDFGQYVKRAHPWIYTNLWKGDLEKTFNLVYGLGPVQGGKKEGTPGLMSFAQPPVPTAFLAGLTDRKVLANLRSYVKDFNKETTKALQKYTSSRGAVADKSIAGKYSTITTAEQRKLYSAADLAAGKHISRSYLAGTISDADIVAAGQDILKGKYKEKFGKAVRGSLSKAKFDQLYAASTKKERIELNTIRMDMLKGVEADASVYARSIAEDFAVSMQYSKEIARDVVEEEIQKLAIKAIGHTDEYKNEATREQALKKVLDNRKDELRTEAVRHILKLKNSSKLVIKDDPTSAVLGIDITEKNRNKTFTSRGGKMSDFRSVISDITEQLLGLAFVKHGYSEKDVFDENGNLKMVIGRGEHKLKTRDTFNGMLESTIGQLERTGHSNSQIIAEINRQLPGVLKFVEGAGLDINEVALQHMIDTEGGITGVLLKLGKVMGEAYGLKGNAVRKVGDPGEEILQWAERPLPLSQGAEMSSIDRYQGTGPNASRKKYDRLDLYSFKASIENMRKLAPKLDLTPWENKAKELEGALAKKEEDFKRRYMVNTKNSLFATFQQENEKTSKQRANELGLQFNVEELVPAGGFGDIEFDQESGRGGISAQSGAAALRRIREAQTEEFNRNKDKYLEKGIRSPDEVPFVFYATDSSGNVIPVYASDSSGTEHTGYHVRGGVFELGPEYSVGGETYAVTDAIGAETIRQLRTISELSKFDLTTMSAPEQRKKQERAGEKIAQSYNNILDSINKEKKGSIYKEYHTLEEKSGGYFLAQAMNTEVFNNLSDIYGVKSGAMPSLALSSKDVETMLTELAPDELKSLYKDLFKHGPKKGLTSEQMIGAIKQAINPMSKKYKGAISGQILMMRYPILKMVDDSVQAGAIILDSIEEGNALINPDLLRTMHGDFDGDRLAIYNAALNGDLSGAIAAGQKYYTKLAKRQEQARKAESKGSSLDIGKVSELEDPLNKAEQLMKAMYANVGAEWAGRSGKLLRELTGDLGADGSLGGVRQLINLIGQSYQTGINIKNVSTKKLKGHNPADLLNSLYYQATQSGTFDTREGLERFFATMRLLGIVGEKDDMFSGEVMANLMDARAELGITDQFVEGVSGLTEDAIIKDILKANEAYRTSHGGTSLGVMIQNRYKNSEYKFSPDDIFGGRQYSEVGNAGEKSALATAGKILSSSHGFTSTTEAKRRPFLGTKNFIYARTKSSFFDQLEKLDINDPVAREKFIDTHKDEFATSISMLGGTAAHHFAELANSKGKLNKAQREAEENILHNYEKLYALGALTLDPTLAEIRGITINPDGSFDYAQAARAEMASRMGIGTAMAQRMDEHLGPNATKLAEISIPGVAFGKEEASIADLVSFVVDEEGKKHFTVSDYKTRGSTDLHADDIAQVLNEISNLQLLEQALEASGATSAEDFLTNFALGHGYTGQKANAQKVAQLYNKHINSGTKQEQSAKKQRAAALMNALIGGNNYFSGAITVTDNVGRSKTYTPDLYAEQTSRLLDSFGGTEIPKFKEEELLALIAESKSLEDEGRDTPLNKEGLAKQYIEEYRELLGDKEKYSLKRVDLAAKQGSKALSPEEQAKITEDLKEVDSYLAEHIEKRLSKLLQLIRETDATATSADMDTLISKLEKEGSTVSDRLVVEGALAGRRAKIDEYKRIRSDRQSAYSAYKDLYGYESRINSVDAALVKETNQDKRDILEQEKADLEELRNIAQETVDLLAEAHKNDPNWTGAGGYLATGQRRARLDTRVRERAEKAQTADGGLLGDISGQFSNYFSRFVVGRAAMNIMAKLRQGIKLLVQNAKALDGTLTNLRIVTNGTKEDTRRLMTEYSNLGQKIGATTQEVSASALEWQRQGYQTAQIQDLVTASLYLSKLGMIDATAATKDLTNQVRYIVIYRKINHLICWEPLRASFAN